MPRSPRVSGTNTRGRASLQRLLSQISSVALTIITYVWPWTVFLSGSSWLGLRQRAASLANPDRAKDACYDRGITFRLKSFLKDGSSIQNRRKLVTFLHDSRCVPRPWYFSSGMCGGFIFFQHQFLREALSSQIEG